MQLSLSLYNIVLIRAEVNGESGAHWTLIGLCLVLPVFCGLVYIYVLAKFVNKGVLISNKIESEDVAAAFYFNGAFSYHRENLCCFGRLDIGPRFIYIRGLFLGLIGGLIVYLLYTSDSIGTILSLSVSSFLVISAKAPMVMAAPFQGKGTMWNYRHFQRAVLRRYRKGFGRPAHVPSAFDIDPRLRSSSLHSSQRRLRGSSGDSQV